MTESFEEYWDSLTRQDPDLDIVGLVKKLARKIYDLRCLKAEAAKGENLISSGCLADYIDDLSRANEATKANEQQFGGGLDYWADAPDWARSCAWDRDGLFYYYDICKLFKALYDDQWDTEGVCERRDEFDRPPLTDAEWEAMQPIQRPVDSNVYSADDKGQDIKSGWTKDRVDKGLALIEKIVESTKVRKRND